MYRVLFALTILVIFTCEMLAVTAAPLSVHLKKLNDQRHKRDVADETAHDDLLHTADLEETSVESAEDKSDVPVGVDTLTTLVGGSDGPREVVSGTAGGGSRRRSRRSAVWLLHATMHLCEVRPLICSIKLKDGDTEVDIRLESE